MWKLCNCNNMCFTHHTHTVFSGHDAQPVRSSRLEPGRVCNKKTFRSSEHATRSKSLRRTYFYPCFSRSPGPVNYGFKFHTLFLFLSWLFSLLLRFDRSNFLLACKALNSHHVLLGCKTEVSEHFFEKNWFFKFSGSTYSHHLSDLSASCEQLDLEGFAFQPDK